MADRIEELERRIQRIEAFLDQYIQARQHAAMLANPYGSGWINPFHGSGAVGLNPYVMTCGNKVT